MTTAPRTSSSTTWPPAELATELRDALAATAKQYAADESERPGIESARPPACDDEAASSVDG